MSVLLLTLVLALQSTAESPAINAASNAGYTLGANDVVVVNVLRQTALSGRYQIGPEGSFEFPLIGTVEARGKDVGALEREIAERLSQGYLRRPQVSVSVAEYASQKVFVIGEVQRPGEIPVTGRVTLLGALAEAGGLTPNAGGELTLIRPTEARAVEGPALPGEPDVTIVLRASVRDLRNGTLSRNDTLRSGDTLFVPQAQSFQVLGQVQRAGSFTYEAGLTVLRALSLAGGATELGATNRLKIVRVIDGRQTEIPARLEDRVEPGDTLIIPTRRW